MGCLAHSAGWMLHSSGAQPSLHPWIWEKTPARAQDVFYLKLSFHKLGKFRAEMGRSLLTICYLMEECIDQVLQNLLQENRKRWNDLKLFN